MEAPLDLDGLPEDVRLSLLEVLRAEAAMSLKAIFERIGNS